MSKVDIERLDSVTKNDTTATEQINDNFQALKQAIENTVSRDGTVPNYMDADLDLNSYRIINAGEPVNKHDVVTLEYFEEQAGGAIEAAAEAKASASRAASSAQSALVASNNAIGQLAQVEGLLIAAEGQLEETRTYVEEAVTDIAEIRDSAVETVDNTVAAALEGIRQEAVDAAESVIESVVGQYTDRAEAAANNAEADATNAAESATLAAEDANDAAHWAEDARIWAVGNDTEVNTIAPNQGKHSAETYASMAATSANLAEIKNKITNCITEIPQDIKCDIVDGVFTVYRGTSAYYPNGAGVFGKFTLQANRAFVEAVSNTARKIVIALNPANGTLLARGLEESVSGAGVTTVGGFAYDTTANKIGYYSSAGVLQYDICTFPIVIVSTNSEGKITSIDQVFNGFGYIGSTVYALPGVKGLIPNGRNADGSLKNIEVTLDRVQTRVTPVTNLNGYFCIGSNGGVNYDRLDYWTYDSDKNYFTHGDERIYFYHPVKATTDSTGVITSFTPKLPFRAVDQNDFNKLDEEAAKLADNNTFTGANSFTKGLLIRKPAPSTSAFYSDVFSVQVDKRYDAFAYQGTYYTNILKDSGGNYLTYTGLSRYADGSSAQSIGARSYMANGTRVDCVITAKALSDGTIQATAPNPASTSNSQDIATTDWVNTALRGSIMAYAGATAPTGWLKCDGSAVSRTTYSALFAIIGTTYGAGNGSTTFNLPNFVNKTFWGGTGAGKSLSQTLPNIKGTFAGGIGDKATATGAFTRTGTDTASTKVDAVGDSNAYSGLFSFNANSSNSVYQDGAVVRPNVIQTLICIKY